VAGGHPHIGKGLVEIESPQGFAAEASSAAIILSSSAAGMALSTTHVATGSILGSGVGKPGARCAGRSQAAWRSRGWSPLPAAALVGALSFWLSHAVAGATTQLMGDGLISHLVGCRLHLVACQQQKVDSSNVNANWDDSTKLRRSRRGPRAEGFHGQGGSNPQPRQPRKRSCMT